MKEHAKNKWTLKGKAARFSRNFFGYLVHLIGGSPVCIMGFENTGTPYASEVYGLFENMHPDIRRSKISVNDGRISGFRKECIQNRKILVFTESPRDRGGVYASDIAKKYDSLRNKYNLRGLKIITVNPFIVYDIEQIRRQHYLL